MRAPGAAVDACSGRPVPVTEQDGVVLLRCTSHVRPPLPSSTIRPITARPGAGCVESVEIASQAPAIRAAGARPIGLPASGADTMRCTSAGSWVVVPSASTSAMRSGTRSGNGRATQLFFRTARCLRYKARGPAFPKTLRAAIGCVRNRRAKSRVARIFFAEAMNTNTVTRCHAELRTASSVRAHWRCA